MSPKRRRAEAGSLYVSQGTRAHTLIWSAWLLLDGSRPVLARWVRCWRSWLNTERCATGTVLPSIVALGNRPMTCSGTPRGGTVCKGEERPSAGTTRPGEQARRAFNYGLR